MPQPEIFHGLSSADGMPLDVADVAGLQKFVDDAYLVDGKPAKARLMMERLRLAAEGTPSPGGERVQRPAAERAAASAALDQVRQYHAENYRDSEPPGARPVPHQVHFVWFGREPSEAALANLRAWGARAAAVNRDLPDGAEPWTVNLWTDQGTPMWSGSAEWRPEVLAGLDEAGVRLRTESLAVVAERSRQGLADGDPGRLAGIWSTSLENKAFNLAADVTRYAVLEEHGGIYADVDIAPGGVSLAGVADLRMRQDDLPLLAPQLRDATVVNRVLGHDIDERISPDDLRAAADHQYERGDFNNNFIVTPAGSAFIGSISDTIPVAYDNYRENFARGMPEAEFLATLKEQAPDISGPNRWNAHQLLPESDIARHAAATLGIDSQVLPNGQIVSSVRQTDYQALLDPAGMRAIGELTWVTAESDVQLDARTAGSLDQLMSVSPNLASVRQNQDVIERNRAEMSAVPVEGAMPRDLTAELDRAVKWFGNDGPLERLRYDRENMSPQDKLAIAGLTQLCGAMESKNLTPGIKRDMGKVMDGLNPVVAMLEERQNAVLAALDTGLQQGLITGETAEVVRGQGATTAGAARERNEAIQALAELRQDGGDPLLANELVKPAVPDLDPVLAKQTLRLNDLSAPEVDAARAQHRVAAGQAVVDSGAGFPSEEHRQRAQQRLGDFSPKDRTAVLDAVGTLSLARGSLGKDGRELDGLWERAVGDQAAEVAAERADVAALDGQAGAMEGGFLHLLSRPGVSDERVLAAAETLSRLDASLVEPRSMLPTHGKLDPMAGAGADFLRTYAAGIEETAPAHALREGAAPGITAELRTTLQDTADRMAPEALRKGLERVDRLSPELGKHVHDARLRLGQPAADEEPRIAAARASLDSQLVALGELDKRTRGRWLREEPELLNGIADDAREAHKATQQPSSFVQKVVDKVGHELAKQELAVRGHGARHHMDQDMGIGGYAEATVKGVVKATSSEIGSLQDRIRQLGRSGHDRPEVRSDRPEHAQVQEHAQHGPSLS